MRSEISGLLYHTLTADYEYFLSNRENLQLPFQIKLSKNPTTFFGTLIAFLESTLNFQFSKKKNETHRSSISEVIDSEICTYLNA